MTHLPKLAFPNGMTFPHLTFPHPQRAFPMWLPAALLALSLGAALMAAQVALGRTSLTSEGQPSLSPIEAYVMTFVNTWSADRDPLVTVRDGGEAKASNVYGVEYAGVRYYYQLTRQASFDPLRTGEIGGYEKVAVVDAGTPWEVFIYRAK
ncbi:MAG: hypothetical protein NTZ05_15280 [Chloroflexi bacterium]|nr:hypothetical protein [Chloroflexota bacterium]